MANATVRTVANSTRLGPPPDAEPVPVLGALGVAVFVADFAVLVAVAVAVAVEVAVLVVVAVTVGCAGWIAVIGALQNVRPASAGTTWFAAYAGSKPSNDPSGRCFESR